jgi:hypothetical protein
MTHPVYLSVAVWGALFVLGLLVVMVYRQLGRVFAASGPSRDVGPALGSTATAFDYVRLSDQTTQSFVPGNGQPAFLAFVDPTCPTCEALVESLGKAAAARDLSGLRVLLVMSDPPEYVQISNAFRSTELEIGRPMTASARDAYRAFATPLLIALDAAGIVRAARPVTELKDIRAFSQAVVSPLPSSELVHDESAADATDMRPQTDGAKASRSNQEVLSHDLN